jgi:Holliday junction resolvase
MSKADDGLRQVFTTHIVAHWQAIETGGTGKGVPDLNGCRGGVDVWIEMKRARHWTVPEMKPEQVGWIERRERNGGRVFVAVRRAHDELWLLKPGAARLLIGGTRLDLLPRRPYPRPLGGRSRPVGLAESD